MLYMTGVADDKEIRILVLESENLELIKAGKPLKSPDGLTLVAWTPAPEWLALQIAACDGSGESIGRLIEEASKRPQEPLRKSHPTEYVKIDFPDPPG